LNLTVILIYNNRYYSCFGENFMTIAAFLTEVSNLLKTGSATEHSYRPALQALFQNVLKVEAINEPKHEKYGAPDFIINRGSTPVGHVEAKDIGIKLDSTISDSQLAKPKSTNGKQLQRYRAALPNLLYTDGLVWYWFVQGELRQDEPIVLATWNNTTKKLTPTPTGVADLERLLTQFGTQDAVTVSKPRDLAERLARIAHWLRDVIIEVFDTQTSQGALHQQLEAFRKTLLPGLEPAEFADMYAQTIVYGLFAARVSQPTKSAFTRLDAAQAIPKTNPFLRSLFQQIAGFDLDERIAWLVDDCASLLAHTDMSEVMRDFGRATRQEDPVVHFYETFLAAYDPRMREARGVYYTPEPVVSFIVRSVHSILQTYFKKDLGLADENTIILDPATGTATFLNTVVQHIHQELADQGLAGTWDKYVPEKLLNRVFGFELLMAPYTIAHLKLGLLLKELGYTFGSDQRLGVYLTNTLSDPPSIQHMIPFAQNIAEEGKAASRIKQHKNVMVVLGNPPYSGVSANTDSWIMDLLRGKLPDGTKTSNYYEVDGGPLGERNPKWLQNDYVKFIRFGQWRINSTGEGILAFITDNSYLDNPTFRGMRQSLMKEFDKIYILNLHGNNTRKERSPDNTRDENVFDIQQGVAISIFIKRSNQDHFGAKLHYADLWGDRDSKYDYLKNTQLEDVQWADLLPNAPWYRFLPQNLELQPEYNNFWKVTDIFPVHNTGLVTGRDEFVINNTYQEAADKLAKFTDLTISDNDIANTFSLSSTNSWSIPRARLILSRDDQLEKSVSNFHFHPLDLRRIIYADALIERPRRDTMQHMLQDNLGFVITRTAAQTMDYNHFFVVDTPINARYFPDRAGVPYLCPLYLYPTNGQGELGKPIARRANLSSALITEFVQSLGLSWIDDGKGDLITTFGPEDIFHYIYAIFHNPTYRKRYGEFLKIDFPRLPITSNKDTFITLSQLGAQLIDLHLFRLSGIGGVGGLGGSTILRQPGKQGVSFPTGGSSAVEKITYHPPHDDQLGEVHINSTQKFVGIDPETWEMQIGGYQPLEKWLKDRKGRTLSTDDITHYLRMIIALRETRRLMGEIDMAIGEWPIQ
jgi:predicted helicase